MSRNSSGIYSLPVSSYVSGTVIKSADMNSNLSDIATALTQSISSNGLTNLTAPIKAFDGIVAAPGYTFASDLTTGVYRVNAGVIGIATSGGQVGTFNANQTATWNGLHTFSAGATFTTTATFNGNATLAAGATFTLNSTTYVFGAGAVTAFITTLALNYTLLFTVDGGGSVPTTGVKGYMEVPYNCTISRWTIVADQSGSAVVDVTKSSYAGFPPSVSIAGTAKPTLTAAQKNQTSTLTGWTTTWTAGDILGFNLQSVTTCTRIQVSMLVTRTGQ